MILLSCGYDIKIDPLFVNSPSCEKNSPSRASYMMRPAIAVTASLPGGSLNGGPGLDLSKQYAYNSDI
jgi:hypothetical protein